MAPTVLVVDDDVNFANTLVQVLRDAGYEAGAVTSGEQAMQQYEAMIQAGTPIYGFIVDALLPKLNGYEVINALKTRGHKGPIVYASGMYKAKDHLAQAKQLGATATFGKPLNNEALIKAIGGVQKAKAQTKSGSVAKAMPDQGLLLETPIIHLLWRAHREEQSGILDVFADDGERTRIYIHKGVLALATSTQANLNVAAELAAQQVIDDATYGKVLESAHSKQKGLADILRQEAHASPDEIVGAYREIAPKVLANVMAAIGTFRFVSNEDFLPLISNVELSLFDAAIDAIRELTSVELEPHLNPRAQLRLAPGKNFEEIRPYLRGAAGSESIIKLLNGRARVVQMLGGAKNERDRAEKMRQLFLLMSTRAVKASLEVIDTSKPSAENLTIAKEPLGAAPVAAAPVVAAPVVAAPVVAAPVVAAPVMGTNTVRAAVNASANVPVTAQDREAVARIENKFAAVKDKDHWQVLGVPREATKGDIKKAYFALARDFHSDAFSGINLGSAQETHEKLFTIISDAYSTLTDDSKRGEYEAKLSFESQGMTTDIAALFEAERDFEKGKLLLERGDPASAVRFLAKALEVHEGNLLWSSTHDYAKWWSTRDHKIGETVLKSLEAAHQDAPGEVELMVYQGRIYMECGNLDMAQRRFRSVLRQKPSHGAAQALLRRAQKQQEDQKSKGKFSRFLKR